MSTFYTKFTKNQPPQNQVALFTKLYLDTTNPKTKIKELLRPPILVPMMFSIIFHTVLYILFCNMVSFIFWDKMLSAKINKKLVVFLVPIMIFGFIGRFFHVKEIYRAYGNNMDKTREHLDKLYIGWIFLS